MPAYAPDYGFAANVLAYLAKGDGRTDDTASIQAAIDAVSAGGGGIVIFPPAANYYKVSTLTYKSNVVLKGFGPTSQLRQRAGIASPFLTSATPRNRTHFVTVEDLYFNAFDNQASNAGGLFFEGTDFVNVYRCRVDYTRVAGIQFKGGATVGDAMYANIEKNVLQNMVAGIGVHLVCSTASKPDGATIRDNVINAGVGVGIKFEGSITSGDRIDGCRVDGNRTIGVPTVIEAECYDTKFLSNRFEVTSGGMTVTVHADAARLLFDGNSYANETSLTFTDPSNVARRRNETQTGTAGFVEDAR